MQFGHARYVYNWGLSRRKEYYQQNDGQGLSSFALNKEITALKDGPDTEWLKQADSQVLQQKMKDLDNAYQNFFEKRAGYPNYHAKHDKQSIRYPQRFKVNGSKTYLPKVGWVRTVFHRPIAGEMKNATVSKTKSGKYFVSIQCEVEVETPDYEGLQIGVDLGLKDFATSSTGEKIDNPKWLRKAEKRLQKAQRKLSKRVKGSMNWVKQRVKVARLHEKIVNQRQDFHHKLSRKLVDGHRLISLENLNVSGMMKNHKLAKSIGEVGWSQFVTFTEYKGVWYGCHIEKINRFFPSSKTCSACGQVNQDLTLSDRSWICKSCGVLHDRDINAAINILNQNTVGATEINACGQNVRPVQLPLFGRSG